MAAGVAGGTALGICSVLILPCCLPCAIAACVVPAVSAATLARESRCRMACMCLRQRDEWQHMVLLSVMMLVHPCTTSPAPRLLQLQGRLYQVCPVPLQCCLAAAGGRPCLWPVLQSVRHMCELHNYAVHSEPPPAPPLQVPVYGWPGEAPAVAKMAAPGQPEAGAAAVPIGVAVVPVAEAQDGVTVAPAVAAPNDVVASAAVAPAAEAPPMATSQTLV